MRIGYSIVTSEIIDAVNAEYGDCAKYQIVCPCCREAIFKGKREPADKPATHYFSHYMATDEEARQCEMRVAALVKQLLPKPTIDGHAQSLHHFMAVLRDAVVAAQDKAGAIPAGMMRRDIMKIMARSDADVWERPLRHMFELDKIAAERGVSVVPPMTAPQMREDCAQTIGRIPAFADKSPFWTRRQASYYLDIITHLVTPQAAKNLTFMAAASYSALMRAPELYRLPDKQDSHEQAVKFTHALIAGRPMAAIMRECRGKELASAFEAGLRDGTADAQKTDLKQLLGIAAPPTSKAALLMGAGGSVFAQACFEAHRPAVEWHREDLKRRRAELEAEDKQLQAEWLDAATQLVLLHVCARIYPVFMGLIAAVPWHEIGQVQEPMAA